MDAHIFHHWLFKKKYTEDHTTVGNRNNEKKIRGLFGLIHQAVSMDFKGWEQDVIYTPLFFFRPFSKVENAISHNICASCKTIYAMLALHLPASYWLWERNEQQSQEGSC